MKEKIWSEPKVPGRFEAIQVLFCGHKINTNKPMKVFRVKKGQLTNCPNGCGEQKTKQIESGRDMTNEFPLRIFVGNGF